MSTPTSLPAFAPTPEVVAAGQSWQASLRAMACDIRVLLGPGSQRPDELFERVAAVFAAVERECTRFDPDSDLMRANAAGDDWCPVGAHCYAAVTEAFRAHRMTGGLFDPRVLGTLRRLGYGRSLPFAAADLTVDGDPHAPSPETAGPWTPRFDPDRRAVRIGPHPIDLGGIGKGLAVRWAAEAIDSAATQSRIDAGFLIDAGGDCYARGTSPDDEVWRIAVEDPRGGERPCAVLAVNDAACVTSSIRLRRWTAGGASVHHLINPRTGSPGGTGLLSVTVVGSDPAEAEVWAKAFFLHGRDGIGDACAERDDLAALWVAADGSLAMNPAMQPLVIWQDAR